MTSISIWLKYDETRIQLPINPDHIKIDRASNSEIVNIVSLGEISIPKEPDLARIDINSFFWFEKGVHTNIHYQQELYNRPDMNAYQFIEWFKRWQLSKKPALWAMGHTGGQKNASGDALDMRLFGPMHVVCQAFNYDMKAGEEEDVYYELSLLEYRPYSATVLDIQTAQLSPPAPARVETAPPAPRTYMVVRGDCLWNIAKKYGRNGANWTELYNIPENKAIIGNNPNKIHPGQVLIIPEGW